MQSLILQMDEFCSQILMNLIRYTVTTVSMMNSKFPTVFITKKMGQFCLNSSACDEFLINDQKWCHFLLMSNNIDRRSLSNKMHIANLFQYRKNEMNEK